MHRDSITALRAVLLCLLVWPTEMLAGDIRNELKVSYNCDAQTQSAQVSGLKDLSLRTQDISGSAGALYEASADFRVSASLPVKVSVEAGQLNNHGFEITPGYEVIPGNIKSVAENHDSITINRTYRLLASYRLGAISEQPAGRYQGEVTVSVFPDISRLMRCR